MSRHVILPAFLVALVVATGLPVSAADKKDPQPANTAWMEAGKADAKAAFAKQAASAPKPTSYPHIIGEYLWSGRADDKYKPFFMFEFRLRGATKSLASSKYRVVTLDPLRKAQTTGTWVDLGELAAGSTRDVSYKLNCPTFSAFQVEIAWKEGGKEMQETYLAWDKVAMVPVSLSDVASVSYLVSLNQNFDRDDAKKTASVSYMLWNIGGKPAKDVSQTIQFKDDKGKVVHSHEFKPVKGDIAGGYVGEVKLSIPKVPSFETLAIQTKLTDLTTLDPGSFTGAEDVEIAQVRAEGKQLKAKVRNGYKAAVNGVVVTITLTDNGGKAIKSLNLPVGDLKAGEERELTSDISTVPSWSGYEVSWRSSEPPPATATVAQPRPATQPVITVDGLEFTVLSTKPEKDGLAVSGRLRNRRDADLEGLVVSFTVGAKDGAVVTLKPGKLAKGDDGLPVNFTAAGVKEFTGLSLKWVSTKKQ